MAHETTTGGSQKETWFTNYQDSGSQYNTKGNFSAFASTTVADGQTDYTGSNDQRWNAVIVKTHGSAVLHQPGGGSIAATNLTAGVVYDISVSKITAASSAIIYLLRK